MQSRKVRYVVHNCREVYVTYIDINLIKIKAMSNRILCRETVKVQPMSKDRGATRYKDRSKS